MNPYQENAVDQPITHRFNPADRLDEACRALADYKCAEPSRHIYYHITLMVEALREKASRSVPFMAALDQLADQVEARAKSLEQVAR